MSFFPLCPVTQKPCIDCGDICRKRPSSAISTEVPAASTDRAADALQKDTGRVSGPFTCMYCTQGTDNDDDICDECRAESRPPQGDRE